MAIGTPTHSATAIGKMYEGPKNGDFVRYVDQLLLDNARRSGAMAGAPALPSAKPVRQARAGQTQSTVDAATQMLERLKQAARDAARAKEGARAGAARPEAFGREPAARAGAAFPGWAKVLGGLFLAGLGIALPPLGIMLLLHFIGKSMRAAKK